ncbi:LOW QUALITY PROTEIN: hypothetical protein Cgig2_003382 [Carnegiea gigantea]|uniref:Uncharacterized protein n=1 Tax=Carnegiea gigantea TaxID=171969 RepID=A0A9Q1GSA1_9CARY|nr:LOW QUALITY PROTEIN: hypothetical protein Cgig2_003382 [Carnegiea gigantea]
MNPNLLLKQYHPKSPISLGALWMVCTRLNARAEQTAQLASSDERANVVPRCRHHMPWRQFILVQNLLNYQVKRKSETVVEGCMINSYTLGGRLIHGGIRLGDYEACRNDLGIRKMTAWTVIRVRLGWGPWELWPLCNNLWNQPYERTTLSLKYDLPEAGGPSRDEELVDAPSEDKQLDELSEEEEEVSLEVELVLVEATSAPGFDELGAERGLPCVPSTNSSSGDLMQGVDLVFAILRT